jgi:FMN-binding domain
VLEPIPSLAASASSSSGSLKFRLPVRMNLTRGSIRKETRMHDWVRLTIPAVTALCAASPAQAVQYLTVAAAQKLAFPGASQFLEAHVIYSSNDVQAIQRLSGQRVQTRGEQVWKAVAGNGLLGYFIVDYVIGKHLVIDYAVSLDPGGSVRRVDILEYRESYGGEVRNRGWLAQFVGKTGRSPLEINKDIRNISGATLSSRHVTEGIKKVLALYEVRLR